MVRSFHDYLVVTNIYKKKHVGHTRWVFFSNRFFSYQQGVEILTTCLKGSNPLPHAPTHCWGIEKISIYWKYYNGWIWMIFIFIEWVRSNIFVKINELIVNGLVCFNPSITYHLNPNLREWSRRYNRLILITVHVITNKIRMITKQ